MAMSRESTGPRLSVQIAEIEQAAEIEKKTIAGPHVQIRSWGARITARYNPMIQAIEEIRGTNVWRKLAILRLSRKELRELSE